MLASTWRAHEHSVVGVAPPCAPLACAITRMTRAQAGLTPFCIQQSSLCLQSAMLRYANELASDYLKPFLSKHSKAIINTFAVILFPVPTYLFI